MSVEIVESHFDGGVSYINVQLNRSDFYYCGRARVNLNMSFVAFGTRNVTNASDMSSMWAYE